MLASTPARILFFLWAVSVAILFAAHDTANAWQGLVFVPVLTGLALATNIIMKGAPRTELPAPHEPHARVGLQLIVIAAAIVLTGIDGMQAHGVLGALNIPGWTPLVQFFARLGDAIHVGANQGINFGTYVLLPGMAVFLLGASLIEIGFAPCARNWLLIVGLWLFLPALGWVAAFAFAHATVGLLLFQLVRNFLSNGFSEEFLFRGLLFTRLRRYLRTDWAMLVSAVVFGLWHFGYDYADSRHNLLATAADMVSSQMTVGFLFAWLMSKTGNLALPTLVHLAFDSLGDAFGVK